VVALLLSCMCLVVPVGWKLLLRQYVGTRCTYLAAVHIACMISLVVVWHGQPSNVQGCCWCTW
jgi:hypothetical protein